MSDVNSASASISVIVVTYEHPEEVCQCLMALRSQTVPYELIVIDNSVKSDVGRLVAKEFPEARLYREGINDGYAGGNNRGLAYATGDIILVLNPDTIAESDAIERMRETLKRHPGSLVTAKLIGSDGKINALGNQMHFSGLVTCRELGQDPGRWHGDVPVFLASGAAIMAARSTWEALEGFDETYFLYMEDADLSLRARIMGHTIYCAADAQIIHRYSLNMTPEKFYWLTRNRWITLQKIFTRETLLQRKAGIRLTENLIWLYAASRGLPYLKALGQAKVWVKEHHDLIERSHRAVQMTRVLTDAELWPSLTQRLPYDQLVPQSWMRPIIENWTDSLFRRASRKDEQAA